MAEKEGLGKGRKYTFHTVSYAGMAWHSPPALLVEAETLVVFKPRLDTVCDACWTRQDKKSNDV